MNTSQANDTASPAISPKEALDTARLKVKEMLSQSQAFRALPPDKQREIARNTVEIVNYLAAPEGIPGNKLAAMQQAQQDRYAFGMEEGASSRRRSRGGRQEGEFVAQGAREGAAVAGVLLEQVNFPTFVSGLIEGVFQSIVDASIRQMEAYGRLVADVAKSLNQFRDENVSANQGRDHLVEQFPDTFMIDVDSGDFDEGSGGPRVRLREGVDEKAALERINSQLPMENGPLKSLDLEDEATEQRLVQAARTQLATSRQQLLATMVLMGINRIIVTDGRISAKVMYDFRAQDTFKLRRSATQFDYDPTLKTRTSEGEYESDYQGGERSYQYDKDSGYSGSRRDASYYSKGIYKTSEQPVMTLASATQESIDASLSTKASLAGSVDVNFKSETFPLEKMADSFQIGMIQDAANRKATPRVPSNGGSSSQTQAPASAPAG